MADTNPIQSFGSTAATNAFVANQFSGTTHINVNQASVVACFRSLAFRDIDARQNDIAPPHPETCEWLFESPEFQRWQDPRCRATHNGVLWIKGKPGAGKSTLIKHAFRRFQRDLFRHHTIVAHFFNARGDRLEKTALGLLRSMVYQLLRSDNALYDRFVHVFREKQIHCHDTQLEWRLSELQQFVHSTVQQTPRPILLLIDALDECDDDEVRNMVHFLESLSLEPPRADKQLQMCLSSRHYPTIGMNKFVELAVEQKKDHREDIAKYTRKWLRGNDKEMEAEIVRRASNVFLWVVIVVSLLNKAYDEGRIEGMKRILEEIPDGLERLFSTILGQDVLEKAVTLRMLQWVLLSREPLTAEDLFAAAVGIPLPSREVIKRRITTSSKGLIEVRKDERGTVQFIHLSVNDFLFRKKILQNLDPSLGPEPIVASHGRLWRCCWQFVEQAVAASAAMQNMGRRFYETPLLRYAAHHILFHAEAAVPTDQAYILESCDIAEKPSIEEWIQRPNAWFQRWKNLVIYINDLPLKQEDAGLFETLARRRLPNLLTLGLKSANINEQRGYLDNALDTACSSGYQDIAELLLKNGADVNAQGGEHGNALQSACRNGSQKIVELLFTYGADVNAQGGLYNTALQAACFNGYQKIVELLLKNGANVNAQGGLHNTALQAACYNGYQSIVELLFAYGADFNAQGGKYGNALQAACTGGYQSTVELLLKNGTDVNAQGGEYGNALQIACRNGHENIVELLLQKGALPLCSKNFHFGRYCYSSGITLRVVDGRAAGRE
ncbi:hypothetical protein MCOR31_011144 [Pyricularia oryzae]|nr:hypothetical protein MCOR31_011144 [Pyricularia oryzae]